MAKTVTASRKKKIVKKKPASKKIVFDFSKSYEVPQQFDYKNPYDIVWDEEYLVKDSLVKLKHLGSIGSLKERVTDDIFEVDIIGVGVTSSLIRNIMPAELTPDIEDKLLESLKTKIEKYEKNEKNLIIIINSLERVYGENFEFLSKEETTKRAEDHSDNVLPPNVRNWLYRVTIRFPKIKVKNSKGEEHIVNDLYVRFHFGEDLQIVGTLYGTRTEVSLIEYEHHYQHSHLNSSLPGEWMIFCLGSGTPTSITLVDLCTEFSENKFEIFLHQLSLFVEWESLEGVPYMQIKNLTFGNQTLNSLNNHELMGYYKLFLSKTYQPPFKLKKSGLSSILSINRRDPKFIEDIGEICSLRAYKVGTQYFKTSEISLDEVKRKAKEITGRNKKLFNFRGEMKTLRVNAGNLSEFENMTTVVHPEVVEHIASSLENEFTHYCYNNNELVTTLTV